MPPHSTRRGAFSTAEPEIDFRTARTSFSLTRWPGHEVANVGLEPCLVRVVVSLSPGEGATFLSMFRARNSAHGDVRFLRQHLKEFLGPLLTLPMFKAFMADLQKTIEEISAYAEAYPLPKPGQVGRGQHRVDHIDSKTPEGTQAD